MAAATLPGAALAVVTWILLRTSYHSALGDAISVRDYLNIWAAGELSRLGRIDTVFHPAQYAEWLRSIFGPQLVLHTWNYAPPALFLAIPLSFLPLVPGFAAWLVGTLAVLWRVMVACRLPLWTCVAVLLSPAAIENALIAQNGALTSAMFVGGLLLLDRRPVLAGVLFGLLTTKPQLGLLVPVCLLATGRWTTIWVAAVTTLALFVVSSLAFGLSSWVWFLTDIRQFMTAEVLERPFGASYQRLMVTPFVFCRWLQAPLMLAYGIQACAAAVCIWLTWLAWRAPSADPKARLALTASLALLATPYGFSYDMIGVAVGIASLGSLALDTGFLPFEAPLLALAWAWPGWAFWLGNAGWPPLGGLTLVGVAFCAWRRLRPIRQEITGPVGAVSSP